jgi:hypothetical protein
MLDDIDQYIVDQTTRKPKRIWAEGTEYLRKKIIPELALRTELPKFFTCWAVQQRRGYAYYKERLFTIPSFAFNIKRQDVKDDAERKEYLLWYVSHELAHIANFEEFGINYDNHGPNFMRHLIRICPPNATRFEVGYKPRNAKAAGISNININDL